MKVNKLLLQAETCKTAGGAQELMVQLERAFLASPAFNKAKSINNANHEWYMEGDKPFVRFELNHFISNSFITMIRPEIRDGKLVVVVDTHRMLDGLGMASQKWEVYKELEELVEADEDDTIQQVAAKAKEFAIANHAKLIEEVGIPYADALKVAKKHW